MKGDYVHGVSEVLAHAWEGLVPGSRIKQEIELPRPSGGSEVFHIGFSDFKVFSRAAIRIN